MQEDVKEKGCLLDGFPRAPDQVTWKKWRKDACRNMELTGVSKDCFNIAFDIYTYYVYIYIYASYTYTRTMQHKDSQEPTTPIIHPFIDAKFPLPFS